MNVLRRRTRRDLTVADLFTLRWRKPDPEPAVAYAGLDFIMKRLELEQLASPQLVAALGKVAETPEELRRQKEIEASSSMQPFEWASHVYVTVDGELRWRCCANLFTEPHSPYCASPGSRG
jgi:hypothetical protein